MKASTYSPGGAGNSILDQLALGPADFNDLAATVRPDLRREKAEEKALHAIRAMRRQGLIFDTRDGVYQITMAGRDLRDQLRMGEPVMVEARA